MRQHNACERTWPIYRVKPNRHSRHKFTEIIDVRHADRKGCISCVFIVVRNPRRQRWRGTATESCRVCVGPQSKGDITESLSSSFSDDDDTAEGVHCCGVQRCVKTGVVATIVGRSSTRVIAARGRIRKHERGARPAEASLIDGECRVIERSALLHVA